MTRYKFKITGLNKDNTFNCELFWFNPYKDKWQSIDKINNSRNTKLSEIAERNHVLKSVVKKCYDIDLKKLSQVHRGEYTISVRNSILSKIASVFS